LLLALLHEEQIDIYDIPVARIAEQFLERIRSLRLDDAADYLEMAARLLRIKAQMLLPRRDAGEAWDDPRADLVRRLLEYQQVREVVDVLEARAELRRGRFAHPPTLAGDRPAPLTLLPIAAALADLLAAVDRVLRLASGPTIHSVVPRALDVAGALTLVRELLAVRAQARWTELVSPEAEPWQVLSVLLALLEMARLGECLLQQLQPFAPVEIAAAPAAHAAARRNADMAPGSAAPDVSVEARAGQPAGNEVHAGAAPVTDIHPAHDTAGAAA
jgi:segregation and condensation protein A